MIRRLLTRALPVYLVLLLVLAAIGAQNQTLLHEEVALIEERERTRRSVVLLRAEAASVQGPLAVAGWAQEQGMVPAPEADAIEHVLALPGPEPTPPSGSGVEVRTVWR
ncbi:MAG: hypothetical protein WD336_03505 [Trueperaceae bacterium]